MKILNKIFSNKHNDAADKLADDFIKKCPLEVISNLKMKKNKIKYNGALNHLYSDTKEYARNNKLNMYTKAKIGNRFMWRLKESGYDEAMVEKLTTDVLKILG